MKVILREKVQSLGNVGEIVNVSEGYARNFLIPKNFAVLADEGNKTILENEQKKLAKKVNEAKADAEATKTKVNGITLEFSKRVAGSGKIFGNVSATDISAALAKQEINVEKRLIVIPKPIKTLGTFDVNVRFFEGVEAAFQVKVEMDHNQAEELKKAQAKASSKKKAPKEEKTEEVAEATAEENTEA